MDRTLSHRAASKTRASSRDEIGSVVTAALEDGPLRGMRMEAQLIEGRPPRTLDVPAEDGRTCRYCLAGWVQSGPVAVYTFLYRV